MGRVETAHDLIESIFARASWGGMAGNMRRLTPDQLSFLRNLIDKDPEGGAVTRGDRGSMVWMPSGRHKYVITEDPTNGTKHTLTRLSNLVASESGRLF